MTQLRLNEWMANSDGRPVVNPIGFASEVSMISDGAPPTERLDFQWILRVSQIFRMLVAIFLFGICSASNAADKTVLPDFKSDRATWLNLNLSPDGKTIALDDLGVLYRVPIEGGVAVPFGPQDKNNWNRSPIFSPIDGRLVAFVGDGGEGMRSLWVVGIDGSPKARRLSDDLRDICCFAWRADGQSLLAVRGRGSLPGDNQIVEYFLDGRPSKKLGEITDGSIDVATSPKNGQIAFTKPDQEQSAATCQSLNIETAMPGSKEAQILVRRAFRPEYSPDNRMLAFARITGGVTSLWVKDLQSGAERKLLEPITPSLACSEMILKLSIPPIPNYQFSSDSRSILIASAGRMLSVDIATGMSQGVNFQLEARKPGPTPPAVFNPIGDTFYAHQLLWLDASKDRDRVAFSAAGKIYVGNMRTNTAMPITKDVGRQFEPVFSANGKSIAFISGDPNGTMVLKSIRSDGRRIRKLFESPGLLAHPSWLPDGSGIIVLNAQPSSCAEVVDPKAKRICDRRGAVDFVRVIVISVNGGTARQIAFYWAPPKASFMSSATMASADGRSIGFARLTLDEGNSENYEFVRLDRQTGAEKVLARIFYGYGRAGGVDYATPSPNGRRLAVFSNGKCWVVELTGTLPVAISSITSSPTSRSIGPEGSHAKWVDDRTLVWASGNEIYRWTDGSPSARKVAKLDVPVRQSAPVGTLIIKNVDIVTMRSEEFLKGGSVVIRGNRIVSVSQNPAITDAGAVVIDGSGKTIIPGIIDTHAHPHRYSSRKWEYSIGEKPEYLASLSWGVTTLIDPQPSEPGDAFVQSEMVAAGEMVGPRVYTTGAAIFGSSSNVPSWASDLGDLREIVRQRKRDGAIYIKSYRVTRRDWREVIVDEARKLGLGVTTEGGGEFDEQLTHIADGHTAIEHNLPMLDLESDVSDFLGHSGVFYTPVMIAAYGSGSGDRFFFSRDERVRSDKVRRFSRLAELSYAEAERNRRYVPDSEQDLFRIGRSAHRVLDAGGKVTIGSHNWPYGLAAHWDLWLLGMSGFSPHEVLTAATISGAEKLGLASDLGSIETGKLADLMILNCNPLGNIRCTADIQYVVANGLLYDPNTMTRLYPDYRGFSDYSWLPAKDAARFGGDRAVPLPR